MIGLISIGIALAAYLTNTLRSLEFQSVDTRFSIRGEKKPAKDIAVVEIDAETFAKLKVRFPFSRFLHADVIKALHGDGAKVIAYDVQFSERTNVDADNALVIAARRAGNVVFATTETDHGRSNALGGQDALDFARARSGNALFPGQTNGVYRRLPHTVEGLKSFAVVAAERSTGKRVDPGRFDEKEGGARTAWIDYAGKPGTYPSMSFWRVARNRFPAGTFEGKTVVVGPSAPSLGDVHPTSISGDQFMSGAEIQANSIATAERGLPLQDAPGWIDVVLIFGLGLLAPLASIRLRPLVALALGVAAGAIFVVGAQVLFNHGTVIKFVYPMLALVLTTVGSLAANYLTAAFERERVRDMFARFVPESVVDEVLASTGGLRLGGVRRECTVMFSDVRGFTAFAENTQPSEVISVLNRYLTSMSEAILAHGGTLIAYMGDGIMAAFGVPVGMPDHADRAFAASREMLERLTLFNAEMQAEGVDVNFRMGIGLNTGSVMAGNVGSERRLEYTAIGDTTNTAARLEAMTKGTPHQLFLADSTVEAMTQQRDDILFVDDMTVRGRVKTITVFSTLDATDEDARDALAAHSRERPAGEPRPDPGARPDPGPNPAAS